MVSERQLDELLVTGGGIAHVDGDWPAADDLLGTQVGAFKLVEVLGSGGAATVFRGQRDDPQFAQQVAIKIIHAGLADALLRDRFLQERQILASLSHPNIAQVFDGGVTDDGRPYLVLQLIDGEPLDRWCDQQRLDVTGRIGMLEKIGNAVHYAHSQLIAHRDLKPGNILVDQHGEPILLDFGVAGLVSELGSDRAPFTPLFAAPEQLRGESAGLAVDIYQLGVIAYQLLTHRSPYGDVTGISSDELSHRIVDEHVPPMSWADRDHVHAGKLKGELDQVVARCLDKDPAARYPSVASLMGDLAAWREQRPVSVMPATRRYLLGKFFQRQRLPVVLAAAFLVTLIGATGWYLQRVNQARLAAEQSAQQASQVAGFLEGLLRSVDPLRGGGAQSFSERIAQAGVELATSDAVSPAVKHQLLSLLAETLLDRGEFTAVIEMLEPVTAETDADFYADYLSLLGYAHYRNGNLPQGRALMTDSFEIQSQREPSLPLAMTMERMALLERRSGNYQRARELAEQALAIKQTGLTNDELQIGTARNSLALSLQELGEYRAAADQFERAIDAYRQSDQSQALRIAMTLSNLADVQRSLGDFERASQHAAEAVAMARTARQDNPQLLATALTTLGNVQFARGQREAAIVSYDEALGLYRAALGAEHPRLITPGYNRAVALKGLGRCSEALASLALIAPIAERSLNDDHPQRLAIVELRRDCAAN